MEEHIKKVYVPMTETGFYILYCLQEPMHGYNIVQRVLELTEGEIRISPGTMYGSLSKMERDGIIRFIREEEKRKIYQITDLGTQVLTLEIQRIGGCTGQWRAARRRRRRRWGAWSLDVRPLSFDS